MSKTKRIVDVVDRIGGGVRDIFVTIAMTIGLIIASLPPAIILSTALAKGLSSTIGQTFSVVTGVSFAILLETTGVVSSHVAIWLYRNDGNNGRFQVATTIAVLYSLSGIVSIFVFDASTIVRLAGTFAYLAALMIYVSSALASDIRHVEQGEQRVVDIEEQLRLQEIEWQRKRQAEQDERDFQLKMLQKETNKEVRLAQVGAVESTPNKPPDMPKIRPKRLSAKERIFLSYLNENRLALKNKVELSDKIAISRPTIDRYVDKFEGTHFTVQNGIVREVDFDGGLLNV